MYPKIGIRPTIDARQGGIRENLEDKTMALAKAVAELITTNLRNGDGSPVECVIADTTIGRVAEAAACQEKFERENVGATITVTSCWCYGSETMDMDPTHPKAVWGFNGTERPGAVYLAAVLAAHAQKGLPAYGIYGHDVQLSYKILCSLFLFTQVVNIVSQHLYCSKNRLTLGNRIVELIYLSNCCKG